MKTTTLIEIRKHGPCSSGWGRLLRNLNKTEIDDKVLTAYENPTKSKEISVEDMQKIVDANEKLVKGLKDGKNPNRL